MENRIIFLGTGGDSYVTCKGLRNSGGFVLNLEGMQFHVDPGPGAILLSNLSGINVRETTAIFVSHNHTGHAGDLNALVEAITLSGLDRKSVLVTNSTVFYGNPAKKIWPSITEKNKDALEKFIVVKPRQRIGIGNVDVQVTTMNHTSECVGFKFITPDYCIGYIPDTDYFPEIADEYDKTNILIVNVLNPKGISSKGELNSDDVVKIISAIKPELTILTHFGTKAINFGTLEMARDVRRESGEQVIAAKDGMKIIPSNYASFYQKRLNNFK